VGTVVVSDSVFARFARDMAKRKTQATKVVRGRSNQKIEVDEEEDYADDPLAVATQVAELGEGSSLMLVLDNSGIDEIEEDEEARKKQLRRNKERIRSIQRRMKQTAEQRERERLRSQRRRAKMTSEQKQAAADAKVRRRAQLRQTRETIDAATVLALDMVDKKK